MIHSFGFWGASSQERLWASAARSSQLTCQHPENSVFIHTLKERSLSPGFPGKLATAWCFLLFMKLCAFQSGTNSPFLHITFVWLTPKRSRKHFTCNVQLRVFQSIFDPEEPIVPRVCARLRLPSCPGGSSAHHKRCSDPAACVSRSVRISNLINSHLISAP